MADGKVVLRAHWLDFVAINFQIDPVVLKRHIPRGLEIDLHNDSAYLSLIFASCKDVRIWGLPLPISRGYRSVFLRYYVKRVVGKTERHGSCIVKGLVSNALARWTISKAINTDVVSTKIRAKSSGFGGEHRSDHIPEATYDWQLDGAQGRLVIKARHRIMNLDSGSKVGFILNRDHHFVTQAGKLLDYPVKVTSSNVWDAGSASFHCDAEKMFGREFAKALSKRPSSVFLAEKNSAFYYAPQLID